jgi:hypothetical protein
MRENIQLFRAFFDDFWFTEASLFFPTFLFPSEGLDVCSTCTAPRVVSFTS